MDAIEREAVFFIADISGYTKFVISNEKEVAHSQIIIRELITTLLNQVQSPINLIRIEGDAVFLYAMKDDPEYPWRKASKELIFTVMTLFKVFADKISELTIHKICNCNACQHVENLDLKIVAHSGRAAFYELDGHQELTGTDAIIVHRLLKNSVTSNRYILLTESAFNDLVLPAGEVESGEETYDEIGTIQTFAFYPPEPEPYVPGPDSKLPSIFVETLRSEVAHEYAQVAQYPELGFHFHTGHRLAEMLAYKQEWLQGFPDRAIESFAGTGNPFTLGEIIPGDKVLDAGSGAGLDSLIAARMVNPEGEVVGIDMTSEMVDKAKQNAKTAGVQNVAFKQGLMEELPVADDWADVVISNGAVNLAPDKEVLFSEFFRVLQPGGRLQVADILVSRPIPDSAKQKIDLWAG
jgi:arsenite methyltransferase